MAFFQRQQDALARYRQFLGSERGPYSPDPEGHALSAYRRLSSPGRGHSMMQRLVSQSAPSFQGLARLSAMSGGSAAMAQAQAQAGMRQAQDAGFGAALQARQGFDQLGLQALGQHFDNRQFAIGTKAQVDASRRAQRASFWDSLIKGGIGLASIALAPTTGGASLAGLSILGSRGGGEGYPGYTPRYDGSLTGHQAREGLF